MSLAPNEASRRRVRDALAALEVAFDDVPIVEDEWREPTVEYERMRARHEAGTIGGAGTWTTRDDGAVLLVRDDPGGPWSEPSGKHESGESLVETAVRETHEETGVAVTVVDVGFAQHVRVHDATDDSRPPIHRLVPVFEATPTDATSREQSLTDAASREPTPGPNVADARWFHERPEELLYDALERLSVPVERR